MVTGWTGLAASVLAGLLPVAASAAPPIRTSALNAVPACVTPERLMDFLSTRNRSPEPRFAGIAALYRRHGEAWRVRWDYAFFQMALETNFLQFRRGNGQPGDVKPRQNNFAGLGTTGGGVPGDSYPDVTTGVLAQIQHLVAYSGERLANPVGARTRLKQDDIVSASRAIAARRPLTFQDLSGRWATDRIYGRSIDTLARLYSERHCGALDITQAVKPEPALLARKLAERPAAMPATRPATRIVALTALAPDASSPPIPTPRRIARPAPATVAEMLPAATLMPDLSRAPAGLAALRGTHPPATLWPGQSPMAPAAVASAPASSPASTPACQVRSASFGGTRAVLIRRQMPGQTELTALGVHAGFETAMGQSFINSHAPGGAVIGQFDSSAAALEHAHALCATTRQPLRG